MLFDNKKKRYKLLLIFIIPLITLLIIFVFLTFFSLSSLTGQNVFVSKDTYDIKEYDYHLRSNATELQKELFEELDNLIKEGAEDQSIAESVVKNYVADAYTWDNKKSQWDVGGMCYVHSPSKGLIYMQMKDDFYGLLDKYQSQYGNTGLLEVSKVEITSSKKDDSLFEFEDQKYESYSITCDWEYKDNSRFASKIDNHVYFTVIKNNDGRFEIVVNYGDRY